jgi:hypothetical protein
MGTFPGWYEAEDVPPNVLTYGTSMTPGMLYTAPAGSICMMKPPMPGTACFSGKGEVVQLLGRYNRALTYENVYAPSDGMYDVTWWYHCGLNDNFGDKNCGGQTNPPTTPSGCRPHNLVVNGMAIPGTFHFPCFPGNWNIIRAATTTLPLKAGANTIKVFSTAPRDAADLDALAVDQAGKGTPPTLMSQTDPLGH